MTLIASFKKGNFLVPTLLALASLIIAAAGDTLQVPLRYDRDAIASGEIWRLVSGHLTHLGWSHLFLNLAGLALVFLFFGSLLSIRQWLLITLFSAFLIGVSLYVFNPEVKWYVGISGVLHGLFIAGGIADLASRKKEAILFLSFITMKLAWEQSVGPMPGSESAAGGPVLVDAHLYGAIAGLIWMSAAHLLKKTQTHF